VRGRVEKMATTLRMKSLTPLMQESTRSESQDLGIVEKFVDKL
jgi:hypothetical protein